MMEAYFPDDAGKYAGEGTAAHESAAVALFTGKPADGLPAELLPFVQQYVEFVADTARDGGKLYVEKTLDVSKITGEKGARGTADAIIVERDFITIIDLKFGAGVMVEARDNMQLVIYGLAAQQEFSDRPRALRLVIFQPRLCHVAQWLPTARELHDCASKIRTRGKIALAVYASKKPLDDDFFPAEKACRFCRARGACPALAKKVQGLIGADIETLARAESVEGFLPARDKIARAYAALPLVRAWCAGVESEAARILHAGGELPGFKLVEGRRGARAWADEESAARALRALQFDDSAIYTRKIITPAIAEKIARAAGMAEEYKETMRRHIISAPAKPVIAPAGDKRPAINIADVFSD